MAAVSRKGALTPAAIMSELDFEGVAYTVSFTMADGSEQMNAAVLNHGLEWIEVRLYGNDRSVWINLAHVASLTVEVC